MDSGGIVCLGTAITIVIVLAALFVLWCCLDVGARADDPVGRG